MMDKKCERCFLGYGLGVRVFAVPDRRRDLRRRRGEGVRTKTKVQDKVTQTHDSLGGSLFIWCNDDGQIVCRRRRTRRGRVWPTGASSAGVRGATRSDSTEE